MDRTRKPLFSIQRPRNGPLRQRRVDDLSSLLNDPARSLIARSATKLMFFTIPLDAPSTINICNYQSLLTNTWISAYD
ncbi:hypothetical protein TNCV_53081 [Trichonephila clavipes]|nr:hypothetical protein TNCV_53081 [Trichonephila clavipes]